MLRRDFIKSAGTGALGLPIVLSSANSIFAQTNASPIAIVEDATASTLVTNGTNDKALGSYKVDNAKVALMVNKAVLRITGKSTLAAAYESLFPVGKLTAQTKVAIKINTSYGWEYDWTNKYCPFGPKAIVVDTIVAGLTQMLGGTYPIENVTVYDNSNGVAATADRNKLVMQGFRAITGTPMDSKGTGKYRMRFVNKDSTTESPTTAPKFMCGPTGAQVEQRVIPPVYENNFFINLSIPKTHGDHAGTTVALKNVYGCITNPNATHFVKQTTPGMVAKYIPDVYENVTKICPCILQIMDGLGGLYDLGPVHGSMFAPNVIAASFDVLAIEHYALELINTRRRLQKWHDIAITPDPIWNEDHVLNAAQLTYAQAKPAVFGYFNSSLRITQDPVGINLKNPPALTIPHAMLGNLARTSSGWKLPITTDGTGRRLAIHSRILDVRGKILRHLPDISVVADYTELVWDGRSESGIPVSSGVYSWEVAINGRLFHQTIRHF